jgi:hypothetical protein
VYLARVRVPFQIKNCVFVALTHAEVLHFRLKNVPDEEQSVSASCAQEVTAWRKLRTVHFA